MYCDGQGLLTVQERVASRNAQLRLAIPPGTEVSRVAGLIGLDRRLAVYPSLDAAAGRPVTRTDQDRWDYVAPPGRASLSGHLC